MEMWQLREQAKAMAEEVVLHDIVYCYHQILMCSIFVR